MEGRFFVLSLLFGAVSVMADGMLKNVKLYSRLSMEKDPFSCIFILLADLVLWVLYMIRTKFQVSLCNSYNTAGKVPLHN